MDQSIQGVLFDLDGVLVIGGEPLPGALETLQTLWERRFPFMILTNVTLQPRAAILDRFRHLGLDLPREVMLTPPTAAARWLRQQGPGPCAVLVAPPTRVEFEGLDLLPDDREEGARFLVVGDLGDGWTAAVMNRALRLLLNGAQLVTLGKGRYWMAPDGLRVDVGAYTNALAYAAGQTPIVIGKPSAEYYQMALDALGVAPSRVLMVGDDILNDVQAAQQLGLRTMLVQTGKFRPSDLERGVTPDWVRPDVRHVLELVEPNRE